MKFIKILPLIIPISCIASCNNNNDQSNERKVYLNYGEYIVRTEIVKVGQEYTPPTEIEVPGYTLYGWFLNPSFSSITRITSLIITEDVNLYAKYDIKQFLVTYKCCGDKASLDEYKLKIDYGQRAVNLDPIYCGTDFKGWYEDAGFTKKYDFLASKITKPTTIYGLFGELKP